MVTWTEEDLRNYERKRKGFTATHSTLAPKVSHAIPQQVDVRPLEEGIRLEKRGTPRITVRITRLGTKLLDADNLAGAKVLIDELRYAKLIPNDDPASINLEIRQVKVSKDQIGTLIEIIP